MSFLSYFLILTPSVNGFAELPDTLVCELCHVGIHLNKRVEFELERGGGEREGGERKT